MRLFQNLPNALEDTAIDLTTFGLEGQAWPLKGAVAVVEWLEKSNSNIVVLGGDLFELQNGRLSVLSENWYYEPEGEEDAEKSYAKARDYLDQVGTWPNSSSIVIDLVISS